MYISFFFLSYSSITLADLTKDHFFEYTSNEKYISCVMLYCKDCPGCVDTFPIIDELSRMYWQEYRVRFGTLNCDKYEDVCQSLGNEARPIWFVWLPGDSHHKTYNRDFTPDNFVKWLRQKTGIHPSQNENNLLYYNISDYEQLKRRNQCIFTILDTPFMKESQTLHNSARELEKKVIRGAKFVAIDKEQNKGMNKYLSGALYGGILYYKGKWIAYDGDPDSNDILQFLKDQGCQMTIATPTPTPKPLPELEDNDYDETFDQYLEDENINKENKDLTKNENFDDSDDSDDTDDSNEFISDDFDWE